MNQEEEIKKLEDKLMKLESELKEAEAEFKEKYSATRQQIDELDLKRRKLEAKMEKLRDALAGVVSNNPESYRSGNSHELNDKIMATGDRICEGGGRHYFDVVWQEYHNLLKSMPEVAEISKRIDELWTEMNNLEGNTPGYAELQKKIQDTESEIRSTKSFIDRMSNISTFRQHAKDMKRYDEEKERNEQNRRQRDEFKKWFEKNYIPRMREALELSLKKLRGGN
jgi:uncharacterized coiled-coil DUF342 family protein